MSLRKLTVPIGTVVFLALVPALAGAQTTRPTITVSGIPDRISQAVDWSIDVANLEDDVVYALTVALPDALALDVGCTMTSRNYVIAEASSYSVPPGDEVLRLFPCETGEHTFLVTLQAPDKETVRREVTVQVEALGTMEAMPAGFLGSPKVATLVGARSYGDLVLVVYYIDYDDISMLPSAPETWWVNAQAAGRAVSSAFAVPYVRSGWGHGILALHNAAGASQVELRGATGRFAKPLGVTAPVTVGGSLGADLILALRGLATTPEWAEQELVEGEWLGQDGRSYAESIIPDLQELAPEIYSTVIVDVSRGQDTPTLRNDQGVLPVEATSEFTGSAARVASLPETMFRVAVTAIIAVIAAAAAIKMGGSGLLAVPAVALVLVASTINGFMPLALTMTVGLLSAIVMGFALFGKRA